MRTECDLEIVARLHAEAERQAAAALRGAHERLDEEEARLESVRALLEEYGAQGVPVGGRLGALRDMRGFVAQLEATRQAQAAAVEGQRRVTEAARAHWVSARMQREAIDRLVEQRRAAAERSRERAEQRLVDDREASRAPDPFTRTLV